jgi:hypothetical protein
METLLDYADLAHAQHDLCAVQAGYRPGHKQKAARAPGAPMPAAGNDADAGRAGDIGVLIEAVRQHEHRRQRDSADEYPGCREAPV